LVVEDEEEVDDDVVELDELVSVVPEPPQPARTRAAAPVMAAAP
jgi:hypothetical protein